MPIDPRTPVIAGVGQVVNRPVADDVSTRTEPLALMVDALRLAGEDAGGGTGDRSPLLQRIDELAAIPSFVWHVADPARAVGDALGVAPGRTRVAFAGGTAPQSLVFDAATKIAAGEADVIAIVGAEAMRSRDLARKHSEELTWAAQPDDVATAPLYGEVPDALTAHERSLGMAIPVCTYALFEHAMRRARGRSRADHVELLGRLAARMSGVAAGNDVAWLREAHDAASITTVSRQNRMVSLPYTKLLTSNIVVDMGAAVIVSSLEAARTAGVPDDRLVFPQAGATAREQWFVSQRAELSTSIAMRACAEALLGADAAAADHVAHLDLYSCFPVVVQMAAAALRLDPWTDPIAPTVTGGMTFFGGPGNNYVTHSIATMVELLRRDAPSTGLVTALGWYCSTHAWGTYATAPPARGFAAHDVQGVVDAAPRRTADDGYAGEGEVESYTVVRDRDGSAVRAIVSLRTPAGARRLAATEDREVALEVEAADPLGATARVDGTTITLR